jgi:hypothetical protein
MSPIIQIDQDGIDLSGVPFTFRGGLGVGAMIVMALLMEADASEAETFQFLVEYHEKMVEVLDQIEAQVVADVALYRTPAEGNA